MSGMADDQVRSILQRILRLKEEQDALAEDIREVYTEAKSNGYDKTALGQAVTYIRKREKDAAAFHERNAVLELYVAAFDGTVDATRAHAGAVTAASSTLVLREPFPQISNTDQTAGDHPAVLPTPPVRVADASPAPITIDASDLIPLTDGDGFMVEDMPSHLVRAA